MQKEGTAEEVAEMFTDFVTNRSQGERYTADTDKLQTVFEFLYGFYDSLEANQSAINGSVVGSGSMKLGFKKTPTGGEILVKELSPTLRQYLNQGMTTLLFDLLDSRDISNILKRGEGHTETLIQTYGSPQDKSLNVFNEVISYLEKRRNELIDKEVTSQVQEEQIERALEDLDLLIGINENEDIDSSLGVIAKEWPNIVQDHITYLRKLDFEADLQYDDIATDDTQDDTGEVNTRDALGITPANQVNPHSRLNKQLRILLKTLPEVAGMSKQTNNFVFNMNTVGLPKSVNFGKVLRTLYTNLSGMPTVGDMFNALSDLAAKDDTYTILQERLGISPDGWEHTNVDSLDNSQMEVLISFINSFNNTD